MWQSKPGMANFSGWILLCEVNLEPVGFCFCAPRSSSQYGRIYQLAVQSDARRYQYGTFLADTAHALICKNGSGTTLRCREDLPSNFFWKAIGWDLIGVIPAGSGVGDSPRTTRKALNKRLKLATNPSQLVLLNPTVLARIEHCRENG